LLASPLEEENHGHYLEKISSGIRAAAARRRRRRITGSDWKNFPGTAHTDRQAYIVAFIYKISCLFFLWQKKYEVFQ
jgi:hypothetical protein